MLLLVIQCHKISQLMADLTLAPHFIYIAGLVTFRLFLQKRVAQRLFRNVTSNIRHLLARSEERNLLEYVS